MATKTIIITLEAYQYLKSIKGKRGFSEAILSLGNRSHDIMRYAGSLKRTDFIDVDAVRKEANRSWAYRH